MVTDDGYPCGEHDITHRDVGSLRHLPEINVTLYVNYTKKIFFKKSRLINTENKLAVAREGG